MEAMYSYLNSLVNKNKSEFAGWSDINWLNPYRSDEYQAQRDDVLGNLNGNSLFKGTKPYHQRISRGCSLCGSGEWSCLFITNKCNAKCFYCPAPQTTDELPSTQGIEFSDSVAYAEYVKHFGFKGVSISGGEPFLFFERTLDYLKQVRILCPEDVYTWLYTNGILTDAGKLKQLADAGLNEIRFDIGATGFNLNRVRLAKDIIPFITVEIPAVPEEKEKLKDLLPEMIKAGVTNLNLHQLRLTPHNANRLIKRGYTIIHSEKPLVLESEITALEIINYARQNNIDIGINYCSFHYKNRFQKAGFRKMIARKIYPDAIITENGYIREYSGSMIIYKTVKLSHKPFSLNNHHEVELDGRRYYCSVETAFKESIPAGYQKMTEGIFSSESLDIPEDPFLFKIWQHENIESDLRKY